MTITHEVCHKLDITVKKSSSQFSLTWEPEDKDMMTIWQDGEYAEPTRWFIKKNVLFFKSQIEKGSKISVKEFRIVGKKKRKPRE